MSKSDQDRWNERYAQSEPLCVVQPDEWLAAALGMIESAIGTQDSARRALDIACGLGHNAIWLAQRGWQVDAVDVSSTGLGLARQSAQSNSVHVRWIEADLDRWLPALHEYDVALVFRFLDRLSVPRILRTGLRPGGWLVFETFSQGQCARSDNRIRNPAFTLAPGELLDLFPDLKVVVNREVTLHDRTVAQFLGRRQPSHEELE